MAAKQKKDVYDSNVLLKYDSIHFYINLQDKHARQHGQKPARERVTDLYGWQRVAEETKGLTLDKPHGCNTTARRVSLRYKHLEGENKRKSMWGDKRTGADKDPGLHQGVISATDSDIVLEGSSRAGADPLGFFFGFTHPRELKSSLFSRGNVT
ncbi:hypothetical protein CDAR_622921 [Caerostris darwini]|uniref:Uncharacterized protein n=1 Tax=Caerostris darwini TaxID=1538125 RepID=A0AAV4WIZ2_9ARAC|nr:hypothetical protein CDAR_622921 [Caerostris darwini]